MNEQTQYKTESLVGWWNRVTSSNGVQLEIDHIADLKAEREFQRRVVEVLATKLNEHVDPSIRNGAYGTEDVGGWIDWAEAKAKEPTT